MISKLRDIFHLGSDLFPRGFPPVYSRHGLLHVPGLRIAVAAGFHDVVFTDLSSRLKLSTTNKEALFFFLVVLR